MTKHTAVPKCSISKKCAQCVVMVDLHMSLTAATTINKPIWWHSTLDSKLATIGYTKIIVFLLQRSLVVLKRQLFMLTTPTCSIACESEHFLIADWPYQALRGQGWSRIGFTDCFHPRSCYPSCMILEPQLWVALVMSRPDTISAVNLSVTFPQAVSK